LILLKSPGWDRTIAIYPVSTLSINNDLIVDTSTSPPTIQANIRRVIPGKECEVYVVCVEAKGKGERRIVKETVERAIALVGGRKKEVTENKLWDGLGVCTWESFGSSEYPYSW